jgi:hypothetical protein
MAWQALAAAGVAAAGSIAGPILAGNAQQDALAQAGAQQNAALRQQIGIANQQLELARPLLNVRDGVLGVLAQRFGIAPPRPALVRSQAEGTALVPVPGVTFKDPAKGSSDPRTNVFFDPVNQNFTTQTGAVIAPANEGVVPGLTQGKNNTVEIRNGQIRGLGNSGSVDVMALPERVNPVSSQPASPAAQAYMLDADGNPQPIGPVGGGNLFQQTAPPSFNPPAQTPAGDLFQQAQGMVSDQNASGVSNADVASMIAELRGMTGEDQLAFERAEAERGLSRLANSRGLRNSGRELAALRERDVATVGMRQDQRIRNLMSLASLAGNRADTGYAQTRDLAGFLGGREDQGFNRELMGAQFGANRADTEIANLFTLAGLGSSGTNVAFNAGANLGGAYGNAGNIGSQLAVQGGNAQANMYGNIAQGIGNSLFDFVALDRYLNNGGGGATPGINPWAASAMNAGVS